MTARFNLFLDDQTASDLEYLVDQYPRITKSGIVRALIRRWAKKLREAKNE